jgi:hypothetical protein
MKNWKALLFLLPMVLTSCLNRHAVVVSYSDDAAAKGKMTIIPTRFLNRTSLLVDGKLLVDQKRIKRITVQNLPDGIHDYHLTCDNSFYVKEVNAANRVEVKNGGEQVVLLEVPPYSNGYWVNRGLESLSTVGLLATYFLFFGD